MSFLTKKSKIMLRQLKNDIVKMIELSAEIATYRQMIIYHSDKLDKKNYNPVRAKVMQRNISKLKNILTYLQHKWLNLNDMNN